MEPFATLLVSGLAIAAVACTKPNPAVCCLDTADCNEVGISEPRSCNPGLACVDHRCEVPSCAEAGCAAAAPVCNVTTDVCDPCASSEDCSRFADTPVCETSSGGCVQCLASGDCAAVAGAPVCETTTRTCVQCLGPTDCSGAKPICDANMCRAPRVDSDCPSGAMGDEGTCIGEGDVVYLDPNGTDVASCNRAVPCQSLAFAVSVTMAARFHVVLAPGQYPTNAVVFGPTQTLAPALYFHGHGAEILGPTSGDACGIELALSTTIYDLRYTVRGGGAQTAMCMSAGTTLERVTIANGAGSTAVQTSVSFIAHDLVVSNGYGGIVAVSGSLTLDRAVLHGMQRAIETYGASSLQLTNVITYGTSVRGLQLASGTSGTVGSSTFVTAGANFGGARVADCPSGVLIRSSIIWAPGATTPLILGCNLSNVIAGPAVVSGASNADPLFVDLVQNNFHLASGSPARDAVDTGPATDFEGDARPQGTRFDIGADEAAP